MKRICLLLLAVLCLPFAGCAGCQNDMKHAWSDVAGLDREIVLYDAYGHPIRQWRTRAKVEDEGGTCYFLDADGKAVIISGTFVIEEK